MNTIYALIALLFVIGSMGAIMYREGKKSQKGKAVEKELKQIGKARTIRDRLARNDELRDKLRDDFSR